jgi:hypothetical protein
MAGSPIFLAQSCASSSRIAGPRSYLCDPGKGEQMVKIPGWRQAWQTVGDCDIANAAEVSVAMKVFYLYWLETFDDPFGDVRENLHSVMVMWGRESKSVHAGYSMDGTYKKNIKARGIAHSKGTIWVKRTEDMMLCETSLTHELMHISIWTLKGTNGDPDHLGGKYSGWTVDHSAMVDTVKAELCRLGI